MRISHSYFGSGWAAGADAVRGQEKRGLPHEELQRTRHRAIAKAGAANLETTSKGHVVSKKLERRHESGLTRAILSEGRSQIAEILKRAKVFDLDRADLHRGSSARSGNFKES